MGFSSRLAVATWAVGLTTTALGLSSGGCARMPGLPAGEDSGTPVNADDLASGWCVRTCEPDYGSAPVDCDAAEAPYEFFPEPVWDFEVVATQLYSYQDESSPFLTTSATCLDAAAGCDPGGYEPTTYPTDRCGRAGHALHVRGGPFRDWGGGVGRRLLDFATSAAGRINALCPPVLPLRTDGTCASLMPDTLPAEEPPAFCTDFEARIECAPGRTLGNTELTMSRENYYAMIVDLREWEGISFWARRGPDSQPSMRVAVGDKNSDDDISFLETQGGISPLRCERVKECGCRNHKPCTRYNGVSSCWDPATDPPPDDLAPGAPAYVLCGNSSCDEQYAAFSTVDPSFSTPENSETDKRGTAECTYHAFSNDQSGEYCFDPNGAPPAEPNERCGDPWNVPVRLNPDWTFYAIPFTELHQDGYAKEFPALDLGGVTMVRFLWGGGWVDYWIDDVRFYRKKK